MRIYGLARRLFSFYLNYPQIITILRFAFTPHVHVYNIFNIVLRLIQFHHYRGGIKISTAPEILARPHFFLSQIYQKAYLDVCNFHRE